VLALNGQQEAVSGQKRKPSAKPDRAPEYAEKKCLHPVSRFRFPGREVIVLLLGLVRFCHMSNRWRNRRFFGFVESSFIDLYLFVIIVLACQVIRGREKVELLDALIKNEII